MKGIIVNMSKSLSRILVSFSFVLIIIAAMATSSRAFGSGDKTPEEQAAENINKAIGKYNNGVKHMDKAKFYDHQSDSASAFNYRATSQNKAIKEYDKAVKDFKDAIEMDSSMKEAFNNLGYCLRKTGKLDESLEAYNKALAIDSLFDLAREYRGELFLAMDDLEQARTEMEFLRQMESPYADILMLSINFYILNQADKTMRKTHGEQ